MTIDQKYIENFAKQMLKGRIFMGNFVEKRYVEVLNTYRDIVIIPKTENELELIHDLDVARNRMKDYFKVTHWIGITNSNKVGVPAPCCLWVQLPEELTFGWYWFKIKYIKFKECEAILTLKAIRPVNFNKEIPNGHTCTCKNDLSSNTSFDSATATAVLKEHVLPRLRYFLSNVTAHNTKEVLIFISVLMATMFTGLIHLSIFMCDFLLKFMHEANGFIKAMTPLILGCFNLIDKTIRGLYLLIAVLWRDRNASAQIPRVPRNFANFQRALPQSRRSGVIITEVD